MEKHPLKGKKGKRWLRKVKNLPATDGKKKNDEEDQSQLVIGGCYYSSDDDDVHRCCVVRDFCKTRQSYLLVFEGTLGKESEWIKQDRIALAAAGGVTEKSFESKEEEEDDEDEDEDEDVLVLTPLPVGVFEANQGSSESSVAATHVTFEECLGRKLKVWWEEDACFYKGVVASTLVSPDPQDPQGQVLEMKITYEDHFEETLPFYSSSVQWINQCIQVSAPVKETAAAAAGAESNVEQVLSRPSPCLDETVEPTRKSEGESKTDYSSCAMGWRVGVEDQNMSSALKNGTLKYQYGFVESARTQSDDSSGSSSCASGDVLELLIRLDSGSHCIYKGPDHVLPGRPKGEGERKQKVVAWVYPPQMNFDFFGNSTGKIFQVVYWNPAASFTPTIIELTLKESDLEDSYSSCEMRYRTSANEDFSKKMDLREAMIQWPSHGIVCKETELYSRYKYSIQQKDMLKKCQYYLFGLTFALVPFVGHSIAYPKGSEFHGLDMERLKGTRILSTTLYQLQDGSIAFEIKCGILLDFSKDDYDLLYDFSEEAEKVPLSRYVHNNCPEGDKSLPSYPYLDVLGKAGDLESTSTCLPMMLPVMCGKEEGVFVASRGLIIYKGFGMSPSSFADMCSLGAKDYWRQAITVVGKPPSTTTTTTSTLTLGQWLQDYKIDLSKTVYFALCHNNKGVVNVGVKKVKTFLRSKKDEEEPYCGHTKELWDVFEEVLGEDKVRRSLFGEWINASGLQAKGRPSSGKITLDDALVQMFVKLHSKINSVPLCRGKEPCWVNRLLQQEYKALCLIREYLDEKAIEFKWIDPVGLLIELLKFAKEKRVVGETMFAFERRGSSFQWLWTFCTGGTHEDLHKKKAKSLMKGSRPQSNEKKRSRASRAGDESEVIIPPEFQDAHQLLRLTLTRTLKKNHNRELQRTLKYVKSQRPHFGYVPSRLPRREEIERLTNFYNKILQRGPSAKSTSINWIKKYLEQNDYEEIVSQCTITFAANFVLWVEKCHRPDKPPPSFFKYKAYFPYFWAYARGNLSTS